MTSVPVHDHDARAGSLASGQATSGPETAPTAHSTPMSWPAPVMLPSDVRLDDLATAHLATYAGQTLTYCGLDDVWKEIIVNSLHDLLDSLTPDLLLRLAQTHRAWQRAGKQLRQQLKPIERVSTAASHKSKASQAGVEEKRAPTMDSDLERAVKACALLPDNGDGKRKLAYWSFRVQIETEHHEHPSCTFVPTQSEDGTCLFVRDRPIEQDAEHWEAVGGHFEIRCEAEEGPKLRSALPILTFAALSLVLEAHLLRDLSCLRPPAPPSPDLPALDPPTDTDEHTETASSIASPPLPNSPPSTRSKPTSPDLNHVPRGRAPLISLPATASGLHKKRFSGANVWTLLRREGKGRHHELHWPLSAREAPSEHPLAPESGGKPKKGSRFLKAWDAHKSKLKHKRKGGGGDGYDGEEWTVVDEADASDAPDSPSSTDPFGNPLRVSASEPVMSKSAVAHDEGPPVPDKPIITVPPLPLDSQLGHPTTASMASSSSSVDGRSTSSAGSALTPTTKRSRHSSPFKSVKKGETTFADVIETMSNTLLSVSPGVHIPPPHLLVRLRQEELAEQDGSEPLEHPLATATATGAKPTIVRQRSFTAADARALAIDFATTTSDQPSLPTSPFSTISRATTTASRATKVMTADSRSGVKSLLSNNSSLQGQTRHQCLQYLVETTLHDPEPGQAVCRPPKWKTVVYYGGIDHEDEGQRPHRNLDPDSLLGDFVTETIERRDEACACGKPACDHVTSFIHGDTRIQVRLSAANEAMPKQVDDEIVMWTSCTECKRVSPPTVMSAATSLLSFSKLLELLIYDVNLLPDVTDSCEHASSDPHHAVRSFRIAGTVLSLTLKSVTMYELRLPMPVNLSADTERLDAPPTPPSERQEHEIEAIAKELQRFYSTLGKRLDALDAYRDSLPADKLSSERKTSLLALRGQHFDKDDQVALVRHVRQLGVKSLNDARYALSQRVEGAMLALKTWESTYIDKKLRDKTVLPDLDVPKYNKPLCHAFPAGNSVLVREDEPASLIAFALDSLAFRKEMAKRRDPARLGRGGGLDSRTTSPLLDSSSVFSSPASAHISRSGSPEGTPVKPVAASTGKTAFTDRVDAEKNEDLRQMRSFLAMRSLGKQASSESFASRMISSSIRIVSDPLSFASSSGSAMAESCIPEGLPTTGYAHVPASKRENDADLLEALLSANASEPTPTGTSLSAPPTASGSTTTTPTSSVTGQRPKPKLINDLMTPDKRHASTASTTSTASDGSTATFTAASTPASARTTRTLDPDLAALLDTRRPAGQLPLFPEEDDEGEDVVPEMTEGNLSSAASTRSLASLSSETSTSTATTLAPTVSESARTSYLPQQLTSLWSGAGTLGGKRPGGMSRSMSVQQLTTDADPEPHVRYSMQEGDMKISVTAFHAVRFALLRRMCGVREEEFIESLSRCTKWQAAGGKSKAAFFLTEDKRFVLKTMSDEWTGSEKVSMLDFAQGYFRHFLEQSDAKPSLIAKIFGVYSLSVKNGTGEETKLDLVVLENLFAAHKPSRTYDLKGIASRAAKAGEKGVKADVLWDSDWVRTANVVLVHAHSKKIISEAVANDTAFLAREQIQDYSALLGVSDEEHTLILGLIDVLSSYGVAKSLEFKAKSTFRPVADVTVLPPLEYAERFRKALDSYFVAAPEKWSAPPGGPEVLDRPLPCPL